MSREELDLRLAMSLAATYLAGVVALSGRSGMDAAVAPRADGVGFSRRELLAWLLAWCW